MSGGNPRRTGLVRVLGDSEIAPPWERFAAHWLVMVSGDSEIAPPWERFAAHGLVRVSGDSEIAPPWEMLAAHRPMRAMGPGFTRPVIWIGSVAMSTLWCNGRWLAAGDFPAAPLDRGGMLGLGLFETMLAVDGRVVFGERHLERIGAGCARWGWMAPQQEFADLPEAMARLLQVAGHANGRARVRLTITAGTGALADLARGADRLLWMTALPLGATPDHVAVTIAPWPRNERGALAGLKCASYAENLVALDAARQAGCDETLFFNTVGELCEAAAANVFIVRNNALFTPPVGSGCLAGIARGVVIELAARNGIPCEELPLGPADLAGADEVFLTSATRGPVAVSRVDARPLPQQAVGARIRGLWEAEVRRKILA